MTRDVFALRVRLVRSAAALVGMVALNACQQNVDLASVRAFASAAADQQSAFAEVAGDLYGSCQRAQRWQLIGSTLPQSDLGSIQGNPASPDTQHARDTIAGLRAQQAAAAKAVAALRASELVARAAKSTPGHGPSAPPAPPNEMSAPSALQTVAQTDDPCQLEADASDQWQRANLVLLNYVRALGTLAGTGTANTYGFDTLATGLTGSKALNSTQADAFKSGAALIAGDIFAARRREAIATYAVEADDVLTRWISALESVANENYRFALMQERRDVNHFFVDTFVTSRGDESALASLEYRTAWKDELTATDLHLTALNAYVKALEALRAAHHAMVVKIPKSGFTDLSSIVDGYISQVQPEIAKMRGNLATPAPTKKF